MDPYGNTTNLLFTGYYSTDNTTWEIIPELNNRTDSSQSTEWNFEGYTPDDYYWKLEAYDGEYYAVDYSDDHFYLDYTEDSTDYPPDIEILYPNGGENLTEGSAELNWSAHDPDGEDLDLLFIGYFSSDKTNWEVIGELNNVTDSSQSTEWAMDALESGWYWLKIRVYDESNYAEDLSDGAFYIFNELGNDDSDDGSNDDSNSETMEIPGFQLFIAVLGLTYISMRYLKKHK